mgnify:CR=1 FL=1
MRYLILYLTNRYSTPQKKILAININNIIFVSRYIRFYKIIEILGHSQQFYLITHNRKFCINSTFDEKSHNINPCDFSPFIYQEYNKNYTFIILQLRHSMYVPPQYYMLYILY